MAGIPDGRGAVSPVTARPGFPDSDLGGDPACWLNRVCQNCGRFIDDEFAQACAHCGAARYEDDREVPGVAGP